MIIPVSAGNGRDLYNCFNRTRAIDEHWLLHIRPGEGLPEHLFHSRLFPDIFGNVLVHILKHELYLFSQVEKVFFLRDIERGKNILIADALFIGIIISVDGVVSKAAI